MAAGGLGTYQGHTPDVICMNDRCTFSLEIQQGNISWQAEVPLCPSEKAAKQ
jgi:hypothetical protein